MSSTAHLDAAEGLRSPASALEPDPRTVHSVRVLVGASERPMSLDDQHAAIAQFALNDSVPLAIRVHFETAKNLYLYAWFVYRFYPVAELHAFATLEFALRERLAQINPAKFGAEAKRPPTLAPLLRAARRMGVVSNDGMRSYHRWAKKQAYWRVHYEAVEEAAKQGLSEVLVDASDPEPTAADYTWDVLGTYSDTIPKIRNVHAHGSGALHSAVLGTFEVVTDLVNQLFPAAEPGRDGAESACAPGR